MRHLTIALAALIAGICALSASSQAAPGPGLGTAASGAQGGVIETVQLFPRRYYRRNGYPAVVVPPPVVVPAPVVPEAVVEGAPVVVVPLRPASCGEYRYWNGVACVDARYNTPYLGPR